MGGHKIGIDEKHLVLCRVEHLGKEVTNGIGTSEGMTVNDGDALIVVAGYVGWEIFFASNTLFRGFIPHAAENLMQFVDNRTFYAHVHVVPVTYARNAFNVIVCHIHATCIGYLAVDDHYLSVVARNDVVHPWKTNGVELHQLDAQGIDGVVHVCLDGLVVGGIAKGIVERTHFNAFCRFLCQEVEEESCNGVVAEIEIFKMNERFGIAHSLKHVLKFVMTSPQEVNGIAIANLRPFFPQMGSHDGIGGLGCHTNHPHEAKG